MGGHPVRALALLVALALLGTFASCGHHGEPSRVPSKPQTPTRVAGPAPEGFEGELVEVTENYPSGKLYTTRTEIAHGDDPRVRHGEFKVWYETGQLQIEGHYDRGLFEGWYTAWYPNGQKEREGAFRANLRDGVWTVWHDNGQKRSEGQFEHGKETGPWKSWHPNGQLESEGSLVDGKREGQWIYYSETGEVLPDKSGLYKQNTRVP
jgi:MORN repeat protein